MTNTPATFHRPAETIDWIARVDGSVYELTEQVRIIDLPVGARVAYKNNKIGGKYVHSNSVVGTVGKPEDLGDGDIVCKYRDCIGAWDYVTPDTTFVLVYLPKEKKVGTVARDWIRQDAKQKRALELLATMPTEEMLDEQMFDEIAAVYAA